MREKVAHGAMYFFSLLGALLEFLNSNAAGLSVLIGFAGFLMTMYYRRKADRRAEQALAAGCMVELVDNRKND